MILLTGGLGFIGSHTAVELLNKGEEIIIADNLSNSKIEVVDKIKAITGKDFKFVKVDLKDYDKTRKLFKKNKIDAVIHFAGYKAVGESVSKPVMYYENNIMTTLNLLKSMKEFGCNNIVFSSSATVYGTNETMPLREDFPTGATNPYGRTKLFIEEILKDEHVSNPDLNIVILRYFNPIGAHESGLIGEDPNGIPNNLMPYITKVATGKLKQLSIFGNDYPTKDGTGVRDYIHVCDLAHGHALAVDKLRRDGGIHTYNLGTGHGYSVLDIVTTFNEVNGDLVKYVIAPRRPGDIAICYADTTLAHDELGFVATHDLKDMCASSYNFEKNNTK